MKGEVPFCVGHYEAENEVCNGDPDGEDEFDRTPCVWRDRCGGFKVHLATTGDTIEAHIKVDLDEETATPLKGRSAFVRLCRAAVKRFGVQDGQPTVDPDEAKPRRRRRRKSSAPTVRRERLMEVWTHFLRMLRAEFPDLRMARPGRAAAPGMLYLNDKSSTSGYIAVYFKTRNGRDRPVARALLKPRTVELDLFLPVTGKQFIRVIEKRTRSKFMVKNRSKAGRFKAKIEGVGFEGSALVAEAIGRLVKKGDIALEG